MVSWKMTNQNSFLKAAAMPPVHPHGWMNHECAKPACPCNFSEAIYYILRGQLLYEAHPKRPKNCEFCIERVDFFTLLRGLSMFLFVLNDPYLKQFLPSFHLNPQDQVSSQCHPFKTLDYAGIRWPTTIPKVIQWSTSNNQPIRKYAEFYNPNRSC